MDHSNHGNYPRPGGLDAQDEDLINHDWDVIEREISYWLKKYGQSGSGKFPEREEAEEPDEPPPMSAEDLFSRSEG